MTNSELVAWLVIGAVVIYAIQAPLPMPGQPGFIGPVLPLPGPGDPGFIGPVLPGG